MDNNKIIGATILVVIGLLFFFNHKNIAKGAAQFYQKLYTEKNLRVMFRIVGIVLIVGALIILFAK